MALTFSAFGPVVAGSKGRSVRGTLTFDSSYPSNGEAYTAALFGLSSVDSIQFGEAVSGYGFEHDAANDKIKVYTSGAASGAGSSHNHTFTGTAATAAENLGTPVFSGTGQSSSGQVITTTDNQTMTLNQCAGMWFISATHGPYLIASNTAVTGAPAVLTIYGTAPTTDAGTYKILTGMTPAGTNAAESTHTHTVAAAAEVANATNLSTLAVEVEVAGL